MKLVAILALLLIGACSGTQPPSENYNLEFQSDLAKSLSQTSLPIDDTADDTPLKPAPDISFHQWAAKAFVWATASDANGLPRFMGFKGPDQLLGLPIPSMITADSFVQADGNLQVGPNGYPVYTTIHMNDSYFNTAKLNLIHGSNNGYTTQPPDSYFELGAAVFKATWLRLDTGEQAPAGAFTTQMRVPQLASSVAGKNTVVNPVTGQFTEVTVALVGLHVVGYTKNHPEFLWATFEHHLNSPRAADGQFSVSASDPGSYTFYKPNTPYSLANQAFPATLSFDDTKQKFSPSTVTVLENAVGLETFSSDGAQNIATVNKSLSSFFATSPFSNYDLIGTLWLESGFYNTGTQAALTFGVDKSLGSVNLANSTAETFEQPITNPAPPLKYQNCFMCHNSGSYTNNSGPSQVPRRIAISHAITTGSPDFDVPNTISYPTPPVKNSLVNLKPSLR